MTAHALYTTLPSGVQTDLEAAFLDADYGPGLYQTAVQIIVAYATRKAAAAVTLALLAPAAPEVNPIFRLVRAVEAVPLLGWPQIIRYAYAKANLVRPDSLRLMVPDQEFVLGFQLLYAIYMRTTQRTSTDPPSEGVFASDAADTVAAADEADLDFNH